MRYRFSGFTLDLVTGELLRSERVVPLRRQTFRLLETLLRHAPALVDRDRLIDEVWGRSALSRNVLPQAISELRQALEDDPAAPRFIETRHRRGYRFIAEIETLEAGADDGAAPFQASSSLSEAFDSDSGATASAWRRSAWWFGAAVAILLTMVAWLLLPDSRLEPSNTDPVLALTQSRLQEAVREARDEGRPDRAAGALRALLELEPDNDEIRMDLAEVELALLRGDAARATLGALDPDLDSARALRLLARLARLDGELDRARQLGDAAAERARMRGEPDEWLAALREQTQTLRSSGELALADALLSATLERPDMNLGDFERIALELERLALLRERGALSEAQELAAGLSGEGLSPELALRRVIELALIESEFGEHRQALDRLQSLAGSPAVAPELTLALENAWGTILARSGDYDGALARFETGFAEARRRGAGTQLAALQVNAGLLFARQRRMEDAEALWLEALASFEALGDRRGQGVVLGNLAAAASARGRQARAEELNLQALTIFRELALPGPRARTAFNLGLARARAGAFIEANERFAEAAEAYAAAGHRDAWLQVQASRLELLLELGEPAAVDALLIEADEPGPQSDEAQARFMSAQARVAQRAGDLESARLLHKEARRLRERAGLERWVAQSDLELLRLEFLAGSSPVEVSLAAEALAATFLRWNEARAEAFAYKLVAETLLAQGRVEEARASLVHARLAAERFPDVMLDLDLAWVEAWAAHPDEFQPRIRSLVERTRSLGLRGMQQRYELWQNGSGMEASAEVFPPYARALSR